MAGALVVAAVLALTRTITAEWPPRIGQHHAWNLKGADSWEMDGAYRRLRASLPSRGVVSFLAPEAEGSGTSRKSLVFAQFALAPIVLVPFDGEVTEEGPGLRTVAPSLLYSRRPQTFAERLIVELPSSDDRAASQYVPDGFACTRAEARILLCRRSTR